MSNKKNIKTKLICIDGADNTGKSTLIEYMKQQEKFKNSNTLFLSFPTDEFRKNRENDIIYVDNNNFEAYLNDIVSNLFTEVFKNEYDYIVCDRSYLSTFFYNYINNYKYSNSINNSIIDYGTFIIEYMYRDFMDLLYSYIEKSFGKYLNEYGNLSIIQIVLISHDVSKLRHKDESEYKANNYYETAVDLNLQLQNRVNENFKNYHNYFFNRRNLIKFINIFNEFTFDILNIGVFVDNVCNNYKRLSTEDIYNNIIKTHSSTMIFK